MLVIRIFSFSNNVFFLYHREKSSIWQHLTHCHTMPHFDVLKIYRCGKRERRKNCLQQAISPFLTMFFILHDTYFSFQMHFKMLPAICFNLDQSKFLSSGNGLNCLQMISIWTCLKFCHLVWSKLLTLSQTTNFGLSQAETVCRRQFQV